MVRGWTGLSEGTGVELRGILKRVWWGWTSRVLIVEMGRVWARGGIVHWSSRESEWWSVKEMSESSEAFFGSRTWTFSLGPIWPDTSMSLLIVQVDFSC